MSTDSALQMTRQSPSTPAPEGSDVAVTPPRARSTRRRWVVSAGSSAALAVVLLVIGLLVQNQSNFAINSVTSQLKAQRITFFSVANLDPAQRQVSCLVKNAQKPLITGSQAECYANYQIALDLKAFFPGKTYAQLSYPVRVAGAQLESLAATDPTSPRLPALEASLAQLENVEGQNFQGQALRGMLLTAYAFYHLGQLGATAADVLFVLAGLLILGALALGLVGARTPRRSQPAV